MKIVIPARLTGRCRQRGLTLVEIMVASSLLLVILVGLMLMFNQTQRAFRSGLRQNDVMENGRAAMDLIARDIEQMVSAYRPDVTNVQVRLHSDVDPLVYTPPAAGGEKHTNLLETFFFLQYDGNWNGLGYRVLNSAVHTNLLDETNEVLVGALYRFQTNSAEVDGRQFLEGFGEHPVRLILNTNASGSFRRLVDGVVHFRVTLYDQHGIRYTNHAPTAVQVFYDQVLTDHPRVDLAEGAMPALVDLEIGILEPQALEQVRPLIATKADQAIRNYLSAHPGKMHIFRRQIPIRTAVR